MPVEKTITLYRLDELSDEAIRKAIEDYRNSDPEVWFDASDWAGSAKAFEKIAPIRFVSWDIQNAYVILEYTGGDEGDLTGLEAWTWLEENGWFTWAIEEAKGSCTMTGFCGDAPFADPLVKLFGTPFEVPPIHEVFLDCARSWVKEAKGDYEAANSDEGIADHMEGNDYLFEEDGTQHKFN